MFPDTPGEQVRFGLGIDLRYNIGFPKKAFEFPNQVSMNQSQSDKTESNTTVTAHPSVNEADPRVQLATERTILAWMRTGLALMAFGFVLARFTLVLNSLGITVAPWLKLQSTVLGILLVILGVIANTGAPLHYRHYYRRINRSHAQPFSAWGLTFFVAYSVGIIGAALVVYLVSVDFTT